MTSIDTWTSWVAIIAVGGWSLLATAGIAYSLYLSRYRLEAIKEALKNSRYIYIWGTSLGKRGLIWSLLEISKIAGMVVWPRASIIIGEASPVDIENFPSDLKRHLIVNMTLMYVSGIWLVVAVALITFR